MRQKLKSKKCRYRKCKKEFSPKTKWQEFCSATCRNRFTNQQNAAWIRKGQLAEQREQEQNGQQGAA